MGYLLRCWARRLNKATEGAMNLVMLMYNGEDYQTRSILLEPVLPPLDISIDNSPRPQLRHNQ